MSPSSNDRPNTPVQTFRGVNGDLISLDETTDDCQNPNNSGVIKFELRNTRKFSVINNLLLVALVSLASTVTNPAIPVSASIIFLLLQCRYFVSSVNIDTLLVVESVGVQIIGKRGFSSQQSSTFLPWNTVQDVFINEVITGHRVLYYLTFLVRESIGGKETTKLVPLFHEITPERKCLEYINTEGFAYPKELTKVIRRIIKSQPRQGQQFGTRHLLVTYNHSPWMRQDKMFAMLKFRERTDATAFPHAFVLTVQTVNDSRIQDVHGGKDRPCVVKSSSTRNGLGSKVGESENKGISHDASRDRQSHNCTRPELEARNKEEASKNLVAPRESSVDGASTSLRETESERKKDPGKRITGVKRRSDDVENLPRAKSRNRRGCVDKNKNKIPPDSPADKGIAADFADLPYQYIIEKEIENSKIFPEQACSSTANGGSSPGPSHRESDLPGKSLPRSPRSAHAEITRSSADITDLVMEGLMFTIRQDQDTVTVVEQKTKLEIDEVLENSEKVETKEGEKCLVNSSLLRLENLITKIEMSDVRKKTSSEDHAKSPRAMTNPPTIDKSFAYDPLVDAASSVKHASSETRGTSKESPLGASPIERSPIAEVPKFPLVKINLSNVRDVLSDKLCYDDFLGDGPEANVKTMKVDSNVSTNVEMDEKKIEGVTDEQDEEEDEVGLELKYEEKGDSESEDADKDEEENGTIPEVTLPKPRQDSPTNPSEPEVRAVLSQHIDILATSPRDASNTSKCAPRIVSNEIVTPDQIPPAMQKALDRKRLKRKRLSYEGDEKFQETPPNWPEENLTSDEGRTEIELTVPPLNDEASSSNDVAEQSTDETPPILIDLTEDFQRQLNAEKRKRTTRRSSRYTEKASDDTNAAFTEDREIRLDMWKFMSDMTRGAKVVVRRLDLANIPSRAAIASPHSKCTTSPRFVMES